MNEYNSIFLCISVRIFSTHSLKIGLHTPKGRAGCGHLWTSERAGQSSSVLAIAFLFFLFKEEVSFQHILYFFSFFQSLRERWGVG